MSRSIFIVLVIAGAATGRARADGLHATATVEVIDDSSHVDDIIARIKAKQAEAEKKNDPAVKGPAPKPDPKGIRPSLPRAKSIEAASGKGEHKSPEPAREKRREREQHDRRSEPPRPHR